jgi:hypothetical protein
MTDLTKITTPFGLLDETTQEALWRHHKESRKIEYYDGKVWQEINPPSFSPIYAYRAAPLPLVTADDLAEALRVLVSGPYTDSDWDDAKDILARYDAQKEGEE